MDCRYPHPVIAGLSVNLAVPWIGSASIGEQRVRVPCLPATCMLLSGLSLLSPQIASFGVYLQYLSN
jgi:hypothetical protein